MLTKSSQRDHRLPMVWLLLGWLALIFFVGGSARADTMSLIFLRPLAIIVCCMATMMLRRDQLRSPGPVILVLAAIFAVALIHLLPLPPALWRALPGRGLYAEMDDLLGLGAIWRPISIAPPSTWNALYSLFVPLSVALLLALVNSRSTQRRLIGAIIVLAAVSCLLGVLQLSSGSDGPLYPYRIHNIESPIGLFANRNHQGVFLASCLPLLAAFAAPRGQGDDGVQRRRIIGAAMGLILLAILIVLGSRSGLLCGVIALAGAILLFWQDRKSSGARVYSRSMPAVGALVVIALAAGALYASRAKSLDRMLASDEVVELRVETFPVSIGLVHDYFPLGSGVGTFVEAYQRVEPDHLLQPKYFNHAHNDYLEWMITGGVPSALILGWIAVLLLRATSANVFSDRFQDREGRRTAQGALFSIAIIAIGSIFDYPLRTPAMMAYFVVLCSFALQTPSAPRGVA